MPRRKMVTEFDRRLFDDLWRLTIDDQIRVPRGTSHNYLNSKENEQRKKRRSGAKIANRANQFLSRDPSNQRNASTVRYFIAVNVQFQQKRMKGTTATIRTQKER